MKTITIQIGNTDNKLTQQEWSEYWNDVNNIIVMNGLDIHFSGASNPTCPWQNACWVFNIKASLIQQLQQLVMESRKHYKQDSIAWTEGETQFI